MALRRPIAVYDKKSIVNDRMIATSSYSWNGPKSEEEPYDIKLCSIKPGDLLQSNHREFPIERLYFFREEEHTIVLRWMCPKDILQEPFGWPNNWGLVPIAKLPLEQFEIPPLMFLGKVFVIRDYEGYKSFSMDSISSMYRELHESKVLLSFLFKDREVYVPSCEMHRFSLIDQQTFGSKK